MLSARRAFGHEPAPMEEDSNALITPKRGRRLDMS
jgi:hypothetical protein